MLGGGTEKTDGNIYSAESFVSGKPTGVSIMRNPLYPEFSGVFRIWANPLYPKFSGIYLKKSLKDLPKPGIPM